MEDRTPVPPERSEPTADLVGALCYALLRSFEIAARGVSAAPTVHLAEQQARFAADEHARFEILRARLADLTTDPARAMDTFREPVDAFYEIARANGWIQTQVFHFVGDTITTDFSELLSGGLDEQTAEAVRRALTGRTAQEAFALEQIEHVLRTEGPDGRERVRSYAGAMVGSALNRFRDALLASNTVEQVLGGPAGVKACVLELLGRHRERLERLGLEDLED